MEALHPPGLGHSNRKQNRIKQFQHVPTKHPRNQPGHVSFCCPKLRSAQKNSATEAMMQIE
jgi:hypothetical protein